MGPPAIGLALDQRRTLPRSSPLHRAVCGLVDGKDVVAVDHDTGNTVTGSPCRDIAQRMRHGSRGLRRVHIVLADIDHRQFPGRRDVEALVERPGIRSTVAEKRYRDAALSLHLRRKSAPVIIDIPPATMPLAPSMPMSKSAICIEPPLPLQ